MAALGTVLLRIVAISEPLYAALIIYEGVFHGIGDTKMPFVFAILTMWGIRICLTWIYIRMFGNDLKMVWFFMIMDNISRCILLWGLYRRRKRSLLLLYKAVKTNKRLSLSIYFGWKMKKKMIELFYI